jgi:hypothetical protein
MSDHLTPDEIHRLRRYLASEAVHSAQSSRRARRSFFSFLSMQGLGYILGKIVDLAWHTIRRLFGI